MAELIHGIDRRPLTTGKSLFDYADEVALAVPQSCGRSGRCRECVVEIRQGGEALSPRTEAEEYLPPDFRLACQALIESAEQDVEFAIIRRRMHILEEAGEPIVEVDPVITVRDRDVLYDGIALDQFHERVLGLAVDVGTTTVVFRLIDLTDGSVVSGGAFENPQRFGGSDVMSRITYERDRPGILRQALRRALNAGLKEVYREAGIDRHEVYEAMVVANSTMRDLFFGLDVKPIGQMPYKSVTELAMLAGESDSTWIVRRAHELGLFMHPQGRVVGAPLIASHVGGDVAAGLVATDFGSQRGSSMLVDIGTNTEIVVSDGERIVAASSPAGPAFEGGLLRFGMPGADGAIEAVHLDDDHCFSYQVIGGLEPEGICGSGLVDILAELRRMGWMAPTGRFADGQSEYIIAPAKGITFSRADASQLAQAKASNASGQRILLRRLGLDARDVDRVFLAGGFANAIDIENAIAIGFLAQVPPERVQRVGNTALRGATMLLLSRSRREALSDLVRRVDHVELEREPDFFDLFVDGCMFHPIPVTAA
ncbi:MAG: ASKHA domain-containing protein [Candidatus Limnocylindrales bacterium]